MRSSSLCLALLAGVGLGSTAAEVQAAHGVTLDPAFSSPDRLIAGSTDGGLVFGLAGGQVVQRFAVPAAE